MKRTSIVIFMLLAVISLSAQDFRVAISEPPYYKGSPFHYQIIIQNKTPDEPPQLAPSKDMTIQALQPQTRTSSQVYIINGKRTENKTFTTTYTFLLTPQRTGSMEIPACTISIGGKTKTIPARPVTVRALDTNSIMTMTANVSKSVCAVGESVTISFTWTSKANIQNYLLTIPMLSLEGLDVEPVQLSERQQNMRGATVISANGDTRIQAFQSVKNNMINVRFSISVIPRKPGKYTLQPATIIAEVIDISSQRRQRQNSFFDDPFMDSPFFGQQYNTIKCAAETQPFTLDVIEPPSDSRPYSYTGLAEQCSISVTADKTDVYVGDPIVLSITLRGPRFPQSIILPKLSEAPAFKDKFRIFDNDAPGQLNQDASVTFKRTVRATDTTVREIPPVEISWFDASDGQYHTSASQPIPLDVKATKKATAIASEQPEETPSKVEVSVNASGPQGNFPPAECLANQSVKHSIAESRPLLILLLCVPPVLLTFLIALRSIHLRRVANADSIRSKGAARNAFHALKNANGHQTALTAIQTFVGDRLKRTPETITQQDIAEYLKAQAVPPALSNRVKTLMDACEAAVYAKQMIIPADEACNQARQLIVELDKATR